MGSGAERCGAGVPGLHKVCLPEQVVGKKGAELSGMMVLMGGPGAFNNKNKALDGPLLH